MSAHRGSPVGVSLFMCLSVYVCVCLMSAKHTGMRTVAACLVGLKHTWLLFHRVQGLNKILVSIVS